MGSVNLVYISICLLVVRPINCLLSGAHGISIEHYRVHENEHTHSTERPCETCPRNGVCVPHIQCPAHIRPGTKNPQCHLDGNQIGVCCFTGRSHGAESDRKFRTSTSVEDVKAAHNQSRQKLTRWLERAHRLQDNYYITLNTSDPSFAHHLSLVTYDKRVQKLGRGALLNLFAAQELKSREVLSDDELAFGFTDHTDGPFCPPAPSCPEVPSRYRNFRGECNNPGNPVWGAVNTGYKKLLPPDYSDGIWAMRKSISGVPLPGARAVSNTVFLDGNFPSRTHNLMFMQFGQFIVHDLSTGVVFTLGNGSPISCCSADGEVLPPELQHWACAPVILDPDDEFFGQFNQRCINFVRTQLAPESDCSIGYAQQMNGATHYPDLSHLYGNSVDKLNELRGPGGMMNVFNDFGRELPPLTKRKECLNMHDGAACFESGDNHGNQIISLTVLHTIWTREHNRIARGLSRLNPDWDEDTIFMEARRIVLAEYQHIVFNEWLPLLLGPKTMETFGLSSSPGYSTGYDPHLNPSLTSEFATAAMRFGHTIVDGKVKVMSLKHRDVHESISIPEVMFQPSRMRIKPFLDRLLLGMTMQPMQSVDPIITEALTRYMFHGGNPYGLDLAAINIQRGRDHGVRSYNAYRRLIGLEPYLDFQQFAPSAAQRLSTVYASPEDIDLWVGGLLEEPIEGGLLGATFANIIADQFAKLKKGDRYFYDNGPDVNPGAFTLSQLAEIKKVTLSRVICDNSDGIELSAHPPNAFIRSDLQWNEPVHCNSLLIPVMDLSRFKEI